MAFFDNFLSTVGKAVGLVKDEQTPQAPAENPVQSVDVNQPMISTNQGIQPGYVEASPQPPTEATPAQVISPTIPTGAPKLFDVQPVVNAPIETPAAPIFQTDATQSTAPVQDLATTNALIDQASTVQGNNLEETTTQQSKLDIQQEAVDTVNENVDKIPETTLSAEEDSVADYAINTVKKGILGQSANWAWDKIVKPVAGGAAELVAGLQANKRSDAIDDTFDSNIITSLKDQGIEIKEDAVDNNQSFFAKANDFIDTAIGFKDSRQKTYNQLVVEQARDVINKATDINKEANADFDKYQKGLLPADVLVYNQQQREKAYQSILASKFNGLTQDNIQVFAATIDRNDQVRGQLQMDEYNNVQKQIKDIQTRSMSGDEIQTQQKIEEKIDSAIQPIAQALNAIVTANTDVTSKKSFDERKRIAQAIENDYKQDVTNRYKPLESVRIITEDLKASMEPTEYQNRTTWISRYQDAIQLSKERNDEFMKNYIQQLTTVTDPNQAEKNAEDAIITKYGVTNAKKRVDEPLDTLGKEVGVLNESDPNLPFMTSAEKGKRLANYYSTTNDFGGKSLNTQKGGETYGWYDDVINNIDNAFSVYIKPQLRQGALGANFSPLDNVFGKSVFRYGYLAQQQSAALKKISFDDPSAAERFLYGAENYADDFTLAAVSFMGPQLLGKLTKGAALGDALRVISSDALAANTFKAAGYLDTAGEFIRQLGPINMWYGGVFQTYSPEQYTVGNMRTDILLSMAFDGISAIKSLRRLDGLFGITLNPSSGGGNTLVDMLEVLKSRQYTRERLISLGRIPTENDINRIQSAYNGASAFLGEVITQDLKNNNGTISEELNTVLKNVFYNSEKARILAGKDVAKGGETLADIYSSDFKVNESWVNNLLQSLTPEEAAYLKGIEGDLTDPKVLITSMINGNMVKYGNDSVTIALGGLTETFGKSTIAERVGAENFSNTFTKYGIAPDFDYISTRQLNQAKTLMKRDTQIQRLAGIDAADAFEVRQDKLNAFVDGLFVSSGDGFRWSDDAFEKLGLQAGSAPSSKARKVIIDGAKDFEDINQVMKDEILVSQVPDTVKQLVSQNAYGNIFQSLRKTFISDLFC